MGRLYKLIKLIPITMALTFFLAPSSRAQDYCSLRVHVTAPDGYRRPEVLITVNEPDGRVIRKWQKASDKKDVEFCDLGISPVTVTVGVEACSPIVIREVRLFWQEPYTLRVIYDSQHCIRELPRAPEPFCEILFRVRDQDGNWVKNAELTSANRTESKHQTDNAGRTLFTLGGNEHVEGTATAPGFRPKTFSVACSESGEEILELARQ